MSSACAPCASPTARTLANRRPLPPNRQHLRHHLPLLIWVHGGGWREGKADVPAFILALRAEGFAVASVGYRSRLRRPAAHLFTTRRSRSTSAPRSWLRTSPNVTSHRLDPSRFIAAGFSAGGHLASMLALHNSGNAATAVQGLISISALTQLETLLIDREHLVPGTCTPLWRPDPFYCNAVGRRGGTQCMVGLLLGCSDLASCTPLSTQASPANFAASTAPPSLIIHGADDCWVSANQSTRLYNSLLTAGASDDANPRAGIGHQGRPMSDASHVNPHRLHARGISRRHRHHRRRPSPLAPLPASPPPTPPPSPPPPPRRRRHPNRRRQRRRFLHAAAAAVATTATISAKIAAAFPRRRRPSFLHPDRRLRRRNNALTAAAPPSPPPPPRLPPILHHLLSEPLPPPLQTAHRTRQGWPNAATRVAWLGRDSRTAGGQHPTG